MHLSHLPPLPKGYDWSVFQLDDGRVVLEIKFEARDVVVYAFQPKRRKCWYLGGLRLSHTPFRDFPRRQCDNLTEVCRLMAQFVCEHQRLVAIARS